jgi:glyoxylase-like metal-dependent hydrolase (beta-lactamase superfamily II)
MRAIYSINLLVNLHQILTHEHDDHVGGLSAVTSEFGAIFLTKMHRGAPHPAPPQALCPCTSSARRETGRLPLLVRRRCTMDNV